MTNDEDFIRAVPLHTLTVGDRFMTRLTNGYGAILGFIEPNEEVRERQVEVAIDYPDGRFVTRALHPDVVVDLIQN